MGQGVHSVLQVQDDAAAEAVRAWSRHHTSESKLVARGSQGMVLQADVATDVDKQ